MTVPPAATRLCPSPLVAAVVGALLCSSSWAQDGDPSDLDGPRWGHSSHGSSYDEGPRSRPWKMEGIGTVSFPVTSSHPEVQEWFEQGMALLHGFWYFEAERSFRWCLKLDPECAMAYWGLALAARDDRERSQDFLKEALERAEGVTARERSYLEVSEAFLTAAEEGAAGGPPQPGERPDTAPLRDAMTALDKLLMDYPDDVEAKALYWLLLGSSLQEKAGFARYGLEAVLDDILEVQPDHVGALHYRIHNWDGEEGHYAIDSCMKLGDIAPNCGHLLHMPGHVLSGIGLWHEAAIAMDRATRVEKAYMHERMIIPEDNWDYMHNLDYLGYIQEQLGMLEQALIGAEQALLAPAFHEEEVLRTLVKLPTVRALLKFEKWEEVLDPDRLFWDRESEFENVVATYAEARAQLGLGNVEEAEELVAQFEGLVAEDGPGAGAKPAGPPDPKRFRRMFLKRFRERLPELQALLTLARGETLEGLGRLTDAAQQQFDHWQNDPPIDPTFLYNRLGDEYLALGAPKLAVECYERTLEKVFHDGFALAGLVVAHAQLGNEREARDAMSKLQVLWSDADPNRWLAAARATGVVGEPWEDPRVEQRNYKEEVLDRVGPSLWTRTPAPELSAVNADGEPVRLSDYRGRNVVAIFYLGDECLHCMEQIAAAEERLDVLAELDAVVLAISKDSVEEIAEQAPDFGITLLSDPGFESARRFRSYDDFEEIELHSTFVLDRDGRVHWSRIGGEPFTDFDFLEAELQRLNREVEPVAVEALPSGDES